MAQSELFLRAQVSIATIPVALQLRQPQVQQTRVQHRHLLRLRHQLRRLPQRAPQAQVLKFGLVAALGAALGSLARLQISYWVQTPSETSFPWSTFIVNVIGALLIGVIASSPNIMNNETRRHFVVTGILGGFTTFSAIAVETLHLASTPVISIIYVVATFAVGVAATHIGSLLGDRK
jgi:fluoride exporter